MKMLKIVFALLIGKSLSFGCSFCWLKDHISVCGSNKQSYQNPCYAECANVTIIYKGDCAGNGDKDEEDDKQFDEETDGSKCSEGDDACT